MIIRERNEMYDPEFKDNESINIIDSICIETGCSYEIEDGKVARLIIE